MSTSELATLHEDDVKDIMNRPVQDAEVIEPEVQLMRLLQAQPPTLRRPVFNHVHPVEARAADPNGFHPGEYRFQEIGMAEDTDSFVMQANLKKLALAMKAGFAYVGKNQATLSYIKRRTAEMEVAQGSTFRSLITEVMSNLIRYHNCFLVKARDINASSGKIRLIKNRKIKPVAGYFVVSPDAMSQRIDQSNNVKYYKHSMPDGRYKIFRAEDVVHIHVYRKTHFLVGTPAWTPVLDDVRALRRIEEHVENLVYQHIYPLFQYKVGTEKVPMKRFQDGLTEVDIIKNKIRNMPTDGMLVTPERHEIKAIGSESRAIRAEPYLDHYKKRVIAGTGLSAIDFGDGTTANRSTASTMSKLAIDNVKFYQETLSDAFNFEIIRELLLEADFKFNALDVENTVRLKFNEVDLDAQIKKQNHFGLLWQMNIISETEARNEMGYEAMTEESREERFVELVSQNQAPVNAAAQNREQPENQHGVNNGPEERRSFRAKDGIVESIYNQLINEIRFIKTNNTLSISYIDKIFMAASSQVKRGFRLLIQSSLRRGLVGMPVNRQTWDSVKSFEEALTRQADTDIDRLFKDGGRQVTSSLLAGQSGEALTDSLSYRATLIEKTLGHKAYIAGKLALYTSNNVKYIRVVASEDGSDYSTWDGVVIVTSEVSLDGLPPFHPNCQCDIVPETINE